MTRIQLLACLLASSAPLASGQALDVTDDGTLDTGDLVGRNLDIDGDRALVASTLDVWTYRRTAGLWQVEQLLTPSTTGALNQVQSSYGVGLSIIGQACFVGASTADLFAEFGGAVFVYDLVGGVWTESQILSSSDIQDEDRFGAALAADGDTLVVGAPLEDAPGQPQETGAAYVFRRTPNGWVEEAKLTAPDAGVRDHFGARVRIEGERIVCSAPDDNIAGDEDRGSAYVFERSGATWSFVAKLQASDGEADDRFGLSLDMDAGRVVLGAPENTHSGDACAGAVYVFEVDAFGAWSQVEKLIAKHPGEFDEFGWSLSIDGSVLAVGAWRDNLQGVLDIGSVTLFRCVDGAWDNEELLFGPNAGPGQRFGTNLELESGSLLVHAFFAVTTPGENGELFAFRVETPEVGAPTCVGQPNSTGAPATLAAYGRVVATDNELVLEATGLPAHEPGYALASPLQGFIAGPGGSQGDLCLGAGFARFVDVVLDGGEAGHACRRIDLTDIPTNPSTAVLAGESWYFQWWYRDRNPMPTSNFTSAVGVVFQ